MEMRGQFRIGVMLERALGGEALVECSILTSKGVKAADVVWCSPAFLARHGYQAPYTQAPELCVEVISPSNTADELNKKARLYLKPGQSRCGSCARTGGWNCTVPRDGGRNPCLASRSPRLRCNGPPRSSSR